MIGWVAIEPIMHANKAVVLPRKDIRGNPKPLLLGRLMYMKPEAERRCFEAIKLTLKHEREEAGTNGHLAGNAARPRGARG